MKYDRVLVTGGGGFVGSHTVDMLLQNDVEVWVLDDLSTGSLSNLAQWKRFSKIHFVKGSILQRKIVESVTRRVDAIIHLAAVVSPYISLNRPELTNEINVSGTLYLLAAAVRNQVDRVVFASSSSVYGDSNSRVVNEQSQTIPITPYGVSKLAGEKYCQAFYRAYGLGTVSLRYFNIYGPRQRSNPYSGVIAIFLSRLRKGLRPIIYGNGDQTRDFIYVSDIARANLLALDSVKPVGEVLNIGTGKATSVLTLCKTLAKILKREAKPVFAPRRDGDIKHSCADESQALRSLRFRSQVDLHSGLGMLANNK